MDKITACLKCRLCEWCSRWDTFDPDINKRYTFSCILTADDPAAKGIAPTLDDKCPHFHEPTKPISPISK